MVKVIRDRRMRVSGLLLRLYWSLLGLLFQKKVVSFWSLSLVLTYSKPNFSPFSLAVCSNFFNLVTWLTIFSAASTLRGGVIFLSTS